MISLHCSRLCRAVSESFLVSHRLNALDAWATKILFLSCTRLIGFGFAIAEPSPTFCSCPLFDMGLGFSEKSETKWLEWLRENVDTFMMFSKRSKLFHSFWEKLPLVKCQQVGSWCQRTEFGSWDQNWFGQTTNQAQLCGFLSRVSWKDSFLSLSS